MFKLFYKEGNLENACIGVHYRIETSNRAVLTEGVTGNSGETGVAQAKFAKQMLSLTVRDSASGTWVAPDFYDQTGSSDRLQLGLLKQGSLTVQRIHIKPFFEVHFIQHPRRAPMAGCRFKAYALDSHGREAVARDLDKSMAVSGTTDKQGSTGIIRCANSLVFKFEVGEPPILIKSRRFVPMNKGQDIEPYEVPFKTVSAMTAPSPDHQVRLIGIVNAPVLISPQDQELIMVPQSDYEEFEEISGRFEKVLQAAHLAKFDVSRGLEAQSPADIEASEKALKIAQSKVKTELNKNFKKPADLKEVITIESYIKGKNSATGATEVGLRRRYLKTDRYLALRNKRLNQTEFKINVRFDDAQASGSAKPATLDVKGLKESFKKITTSLASRKEWSADPKVIDLIDLAGNEFSDTIIKSENYEVDANAQWLRCVSGAGASAEIDWKKRKAVLQGSLQSKLVLCEGKVSAQWATPSLKGWMLNYQGEDLGALRFVIRCELYGFVGAKIVASGALSITLADGKQMVNALKPAEGESYGELFDRKSGLPEFDPMGSYEKVPDDMSGVKGEINAFAGVEVGVTPSGSIQWLPPEEKEFVSFAQIEATVGGSLGAALAAQFEIYFKDGKFRIKAAASLCLGPGGRGAMEFTVNMDKMFDFVKWVAYQLLNSGFRQLVYFSGLAFRKLSMLLLIFVAKDLKTFSDMQTVTSNIDDIFEDLLRAFDRAKERKGIVDTVNRTSAWLMYATPETRGMLLYHITRHGLPSHGRNMPQVEVFQDMRFDPRIYFLPNHKEAVCNVMATVQTLNCWQNVMQHMSPDGSKSPLDARANEEHVIRFLNDGILLADTASVMENLMSKTGNSSGNKYLDKYIAMRGKLLNKFPNGYRIGRLDSLEFAMYKSLDGRRHVDFGKIDTAQRGEALEGDAGSSIT